MTPTTYFSTVFYLVGTGMTIVDNQSSVSLKYLLIIFRFVRFFHSTDDLGTQIMCQVLLYAQQDLSVDRFLLLEEHGKESQGTKTILNESTVTKTLLEQHGYQRVKHTIKSQEEQELGELEEISAMRRQKFPGWWVRGCCCLIIPQYLHSLLCASAQEK